MSQPHPLDFTIDVDELDRDFSKFSLKASPEQCAALVERFGLVDLRSLEGDLDVRDAGKGEGIIIKGTLKADLAQKCIASLEPVEETLDTTFELMLVDPEMADRMDEDGVYLDEDAPEYDALEGDTVPLGEILAQTLSISMDPYPRKAEAELKPAAKPGVTMNEPELEKPNPFAALAKFRDES